MKALQIQKYGAGMLGVFLAYYRFVGAQYMKLQHQTPDGSNTIGGLRVKIYLLRERGSDAHPITDNDLYLLTFPIEEDDPNGVEAFNEIKGDMPIDKVKLQDNSPGKPAYPTAIIPNLYAKFDRDERKQPEIQKHGRTYLTELNELRAPSKMEVEVKVLRSYTRTIKKNSYTCGWVLRGCSLKFLSLQTTLYEDESLITMNPQVYISSNSGIYSFDMKMVPQLYLYQMNFPGKRQFTPEMDLSSVEMNFIGEKRHRYKVEFRPDNLMTTIPESLFDTLRESLIRMDFYWESNRYQRPCQQLEYEKVVEFIKKNKRISGLPPLDLMYGNEQVLTIKANKYVRFITENDHTICALNFIPNSEEKLVLGYSFLNAYSIIIQNADGTKSYKFSDADV
ncbi:unnamed protein product [Albugo candida]|uniref:Peptidase A1 domain-containing protein n=1 Tax=Albugo candida TaxID=65357 RepID=A0A024FW27_9STRA|nr:unnamed protein product [Albugo candida]|eukprot:CCI11102.1 unnamed protein product [Albugo candida]